MTTPTEKLAADALPDGIIGRLARSIAWLERGELLPGSGGCIGLNDIKFVHAALLRSQPVIKESLTTQQPGQDEREAWHLPKDALRAIYAKHELATANLVISDLERIAADILDGARLSAPQAAGQEDPLRQLCRAIVKLHDEHGYVLPIHINNMADLLDESDSGMPPVSWADEDAQMRLDIACEAVWKAESQGFMLNTYRLRDWLSGDDLTDPIASIAVPSGEQAPPTPAGEGG